MIVVAIVGILAAVALPAYQDYTSRAKIVEPVSLLSGLKIDVSDYYTDRGLMPTLTQLTAYAGPKVVDGKFTASITGTTSGLFVATLKAAVGANISGKVVHLSYYRDTSGLLKHTCKAPTGSTGVPSKYLPAECR